MRYLTAEELPQEVYSPAEAAIVRYAQKLTRLEPIDDDYWLVHAGDLVLGKLKMDGFGGLRPMVSAPLNHRGKR